MDVNRFTVAAAEYMIGLDDANVIVAAAGELLAAVAKGSALVEIAVIDPGDVRREEFIPLINAALEELDKRPITIQSARAIVAADIAERIVRGEIAPYDGARGIWRLVGDISEAEEGMIAFIGLASEWEDVPSHRSAIEGDIRKAALQFVAEMKNFASR